ncbi:uncharacterized protein LOC119009430 isoform X2 [Acanthopagrus latus]|uniref:uncharacterized protein LOC119009430 isoform X2 n=1 Tax=Acanthopagrus latus TaxID=8177 RepID=UPI00187BE6A0|nr:uncharacterized protein LOC119009430 isoform X2 [Acanthopagrus latus]
MITDDTADTETDKASSGPGSPSSSVFPRGVRQLLVIKEEFSSEWSPNLHQEDRGYIHIKEEQEELWTSQEGQQLNELEGADSTRLTFTAVIVKSEDDEENPQTSLLHQSQTEDIRQAEPPASSSATQIKTEIDGEDYGRSEPARNQDAEKVCVNGTIPDRSPH